MCGGWWLALGIKAKLSETRLNVSIQTRLALKGQHPCLDKYHGCDTPDWEWQMNNHNYHICQDKCFRFENGVQVTFNCRHKFPLPATVDELTEIKCRSAMMGEEIRTKIECLPARD